MGLFDFLKPRKQKSAYDYLMENPLFRQKKELHEILNKFSEAAGGCDTDEIPNGYGEFGLTPTNPIPTNTVLGSYSYLERLCTSEGMKVKVGRRKAVNTDVSPMAIDMYELSRADGTPLPNVYISAYHKRNSKKAPRGFRLLFSESQ